MDASTAKRFRGFMASAHAAQLRQAVRDFLAEQRAAGTLRPGQQTWTSFDRSFSEACGRQGYIAITWPKEYGGHDRSALERYVVTEELLIGGAPLGAHWIADRQSGPQIMNHGHEALKTDILPRIAAGHCTFSIGMSEPQAGSDLSAIRTNATRTDDGWTLNGRKIWTTNAQHADYMIVLCRTSPPSDNRYAGMSQFVVPMSLDGVSVSGIKNMAGETEFSEVLFEDVQLAPAYLLGTEGDGWKLVMQELSFERSGPDRFLSTFQLLAELSGQPLQDGRAELGRMVARLSCVRRLSQDITSRLVDGVSVGADASRMKTFGADLEQQVPDVASRLLETDAVPGIEGLSGTLAYAQLTAPCFSLRGGTREILIGIIAKEMGLR